MKVEVKQQDLARGLGIASRAVSPRSTLPVLANVLVATDEGRLRLSATNLELGITCWIPGNIIEEGSITVPARTVADLVATLPQEMIVLALDTRTQTLKVEVKERSHTDIKGIDAQEFPPIPVPDLAEGIPLNVADFKEMINQVAFAASTDEARPVLQGVLLSVIESGVTMAATDGFRISVKKAALTSPSLKPITAIIPARALGELGKIIEEGEEIVTMVIPGGRGQVIFHLKNAELVSQLIEGNFPDFNAIIPHSFKNHTIVGKEELLKSCKQAEIIARESNNVVRLDIRPGEKGPGTVQISSVSEETGKSDINLDANTEGEGLAIAFNVRFLREVLEAIHKESISLDTNANNTPALIKPVGDDSYTHVIMPMHLG
jgi:DNA polymerase III subunit beta